MSYSRYLWRLLLSRCSPGAANISCAELLWYARLIMQPIPGWFLLCPSVFPTIFWKFDEYIFLRGLLLISKKWMQYNCLFFSYVKTNQPYEVYVYSYLTIKYHWSVVGDVIFFLLMFCHLMDYFLVWHLYLIFICLLSVEYISLFSLWNSSTPSAHS